MGQVFQPLVLSVAVQAVHMQSCCHPPPHSMLTDAGAARLVPLFAAGIVAKVQQTSQGVDVQLISDGSGAGRGGGDRKDVLPPLMPGLPARQQ